MAVALRVESIPTLYRRKYQQTKRVFQTKIITQPLKPDQGILRKKSRSKTFAFQAIMSASAPVRSARLVLERDLVAADSDSDSGDY